MVAFYITVFKDKIVKQSEEHDLSHDPATANAVLAVYKEHFLTLKALPKQIVSKLDPDIFKGECNCISH